MEGWVGGRAGLEALVVLLVLLAFALEAVVAVAVVAAALAAVAQVEAGVHLRQRVHAQHLVDLAESQKPQSKLHNQQRKQFNKQLTSATSRGRMSGVEGRPQVLFPQEEMGITTPQTHLKSFDWSLQSLP